MTGRDSVAHNAEWLRRERGRLGWSTTETAQRARDVAREHGDNIKLAQQLVSKFENGQLKSTPRWLGYVQLAMSHHIAKNDLPAGDVWGLRLPSELKRYIEDRIYQKNTSDTLWGADDGITAEEARWLDLLRSLGPKERHAVLNVAALLAENVPTVSAHSD